MVKEVQLNLKSQYRVNESVLIECKKINLDTWKSIYKPSNIREDLYKLYNTVINLRSFWHKLIYSCNFLSQFFEVQKTLKLFLHHINKAQTIKNLNSEKLSIFMLNSYHNNMIQWNKSVQTFGGKYLFFMTCSIQMIK